MIDLNVLSNGTYRVLRRNRAAACSIPAKYGTITPLFGEHLLLVVKGHARIVNRLLAMPMTKLAAQDEDTVAITFPACQFDDVTAIVQPHRKRNMSEEHKAKLRAGLALRRASKPRG